MHTGLPPFIESIAELCYYNEHMHLQMGWLIFVNVYYFFQNKLEYKMPALIQHVLGIK
jgi:hypothetical protein